MGYKTILYEKEDRIGTITLNRPKAMNALNSDVLQDLNDVIDKIAADDDVKVVIITGGNENFFAAGADIKELEFLATPVDAHRFCMKVQEVLSKLENLEKPVIAAISGYALGGGCEMIMACDIRIAAENAVFGQPEIKIGVIPGGGGTQRLPRIVGLSKAKELLYTADQMTASEAFRVGLVSKVVPVEALMEETTKMAKKIARQPGIALKTTKRVLNNGMNVSNIRSALEYESQGFEILFSTEDQKEGMKAFIEKRKPIFKDK
jgi:enoyl-CoA hydratase